MKMLLALLLKHSLTSPFFQHQEKGHQKPKELYQANPIYRRPKKQLVMSSEMLLKELLNTQFSDPGLRQTPCWRVTFWTKWWLLPAKQSTVRSREAMHWICWPNLFTHNSTEAIHEHSSRVWTSYTCSEQSIRKIASFPLHQLLYQSDTFNWSYWSMSLTQEQIAAGNKKMENRIKVQ